jgi:hypothetical protein
MKEFNYFKFNEQRKALYMFDPKDVKTKYQYKLKHDEYDEALT